MNNILFIGSYKSPLSKERFNLIKENINHDKIIFFNTGFEYINTKMVISTKFRFNRYLTTLIQFAKVFFLIHKYKINTIHIHGGFQAFIDFLPFFISKQIKIIVTVQGSEINQNYIGYKKTFVKYLLNSAYKITVKSVNMKNRVFEIVDNKSKVVDLNWGIDDKLFKLKKVQLDNVIRIISFRATGYIYNIEKIFKAIKVNKAKYDNIEFTYIEFNKNKNIKLDLSIVDKHKESLTKKELFEILVEQDIMISIPSHDGFATSLMESLSMGVYPILSDIKSYDDKELKKHISFINLESNNSLDDEIEKCIKNIESIRENKIKRINYAKENYSRENQVSILKEIYKR